MTQNVVSAEVGNSAIDQPGAVAIVHDYLTQRGGAERVVLAMHRAFPAAPIYTSLYEPDLTFPEFRDVDVRPSYLNRSQLLRRHHRLALPLLAHAFSKIEVDEKIVLCSSSGWAHGIHTTGTKLVYCHCPARWLYKRADYFRKSQDARNERGHPASPLDEIHTSFVVRKFFSCRDADSSAMGSQGGGQCERVLHELVSGLGRDLVGVRDTTAHHPSASPVRGRWPVGEAAHRWQRTGSSWWCRASSRTRISIECSVCSRNALTSNWSSSGPDLS